MKIAPGDRAKGIFNSISRFNTVKQYRILFVLFAIATSLLIVPMLLKSSATVGNSSHTNASEAQNFIADQVVTTNADSGAGSLRQAVIDANSGDTITFDSSVTGTIILTSGEILLDKNLTITGPGANLLTVRRDSGATRFRIFTITSGVTVNISGLTVTNGHTADNGPSGNGVEGGGIRNAGTLTLTGVAVSGNRTGNAGSGTAGSGGIGGGIRNVGTLSITDSTISGNLTGDGGSDPSAVGGPGGTGGGISNALGTLTITDSTISGNQTGNGGSGAISGSRGEGGGIHTGNATLTITGSTITANGASGGGGIRRNGSGTTTLRSTIVAGNSANAGPDIRGDVQSDGYNLVQNTANANINQNSGAGPNITGIDPQLGALADNGGQTDTHALTPVSPAIDKGKSFGSTTDQRGLTRPFDLDDATYTDASGGDGSDIGAFEVQADDPQFTPILVNSTGDAADTNTSDALCDSNAGTSGEQCTLRAAIQEANARAGVNVISFDTNVFTTPGPHVIQLASVLPDLSSSMVISGPGARILSVRRDSASRFRIFTVTSGVTVNISGLTVTNGHTANGTPGQPGAGIRNSGTLTLTGVAVSGNQTGQGAGCANCTGGNGGAGGGISNDGTLSLVNSTVSGNQAGVGGNGINANGVGGSGGNGGGISNNGTLTITNSTVSGNQTNGGGTGNLGNGVGGSGGGVFNNGTLTVSNSTITANISANEGGGIQRSGGGITLRSTIVAGNSAAVSPDINGTVQSDGFNLVQNTTGATINQNPGAGPNITGVDPQLGSLANNNSGPTDTHALQSGSPAIDKGNAFGATSDQRGLTRPSDFASIANASGGDGSDIGAFEVQAPPPCTTNPIVTTNADNGAGSLRQAVLDACSGDTITFDSGVMSPITLTTGEIAINKNLTITGPGTNLLAISGNNNSRIFYIAISRTANISGLTLRNGNGVGAGSNNRGGAIYVNGTLNLSDSWLTQNTASNTAGALEVGSGNLNLNRVTISGNTGNNVSGIFASNSTVVIRNSTISNNSGSFGEAIRVSAGGTSTSTLTMINSTVSENTTSNFNSAIRSQAAATSTSIVNLLNCTVTRNKTTNAGQRGAILLQPDTGTHTLNLKNTIVSGNTSGGVPNDIEGTADATSSYNLIGTGGGLSNGVNNNIVGVNNPRLGPLVNNGGATPTHRLLAHSSALDRGSAAVDPVTSNPITTDQRGAGFVRPVDLPTISNAIGGDGSDIGAFESLILPAAIPLDFDGDGISDFAVIQGAFPRPSSARDGNEKGVKLSGDLLADDNQRFWTHDYNKLLHLRAGRGFVELPKEVQAAQKIWKSRGRENVKSPSTEGGMLNWLIRRSSDGTTLNYSLGTNTDVFVPADYDGDGKTDAAVWNPTDGFTVIQSSTSLQVSYALGVGNANADPTVVGDYDGDGFDDPAIYDSTTGIWNWLGDAAHTSTDSAMWMAGGIPMPGDYNSDGKYDFAIQLPPISAPDSAKFRIVFNDGSVGPAADISMTYGLAVYALVPGDYDGDGITDIAQANLSGTDIVWRYLRSSTGFTIQVKRTFGVVATDRTVQGDYDGDGKIDLAVYRRGSSPNDGVFIVFQSSTSTATAPFDWGDVDDYPVGFFNSH